MSMAINEIKYDIAICTKDEDNASPSIIRSQLNKTISDISDLKAKADWFGFVLLTKSEHDKLVKYQLVPSTPGNPRVVQAPIKAVIPVTPKSELIQKAKTTSNASVVGKDKAMAPNEGKLHDTIVETQQVTTRGGGSLTIPKKLAGDTGATSIQIVKTSDVEIQKKLKSITDASLHNGGPDFRNNYDVRDCPACGGTGIAKIGDISCPKCGGKGHL